MTPEPIARLVALLARLPGVGEKTAQRLALHLLRAPELATDLASALGAAADKIRLCSTCCNLTDKDPCALCADDKRDDRIVCVVEGPPDLIAVERTREFRGRYHVLHGVLSPLDGIGPDQLRVKELLRRVGGGKVLEVILATDPDVEGEATALYLTRLLKPLGVRVSRIAQGVPLGGDLEFASQATLARALIGRREV